MRTKWSLSKKLAVMLCAISLYALSSELSLADESPYPPSEQLMKGPLQVPREFQDGTATEKQVIEWSESLIKYGYFKDRELDIERKDYDGDGREEVLVGIPWTYGTSGRVVMYFDAIDTGYRFLGKLGNPNKALFHCYEGNDYCYQISPSGNWERSTVVLYKVGPVDISWAEHYVALHCTYEEFRGDHFIDQFPATEGELLEQFQERRSQSLGDTAKRQCEE
ncbi:MAG: FG-GAP repeat protein [Pseudomonadota bacterium]